MLSKNSYHLHPVYCKWSFGNSNKKILTWSSVWLRACLTSSVFTTPYKNSGDFDTAWSNRPMTRALLKHMIRAPSCSSVTVHFILCITKVFDAYSPSTNNEIHREYKIHTHTFQYHTLYQYKTNHIRYRGLILGCDIKKGMYCHIHYT